MAQAGDKALADYVATAISPVLIMALIGSLIFFLVEVLYVGQYQGKLLFILFCFVFGAVLVSRISMQRDISGRAGLYGSVLGGLTWIALLRFVEIPKETAVADWAWALHLGFIVLIWWCAHRLTWDCTMIEDEDEGSGAGLLEAAGLENGDQEPVKPQLPVPGPVKKSRRRDHDAAFVAWDKRYLHYREEKRRRPRTPGIWVVYFSLAALPLYGLGQSLIPPAEADRRRHAFWLLTIYVASGLGLLLTTCFLGLRRHLRQRKVQMPAALTGTWLLTGVTLIALFLLVGALLPRPSPEVALVQLPWLAGSKDRDASRWAASGEETGKGEGRGGREGKQDQNAGGPGKEGKGEPGKGQGKASGGSKGDKNAEPGSKGASQGKGQAGRKEGKQASGQAQDKGEQRGQQKSAAKADRSQRQKKADGRKNDADQKADKRDGSPPSPSTPPSVTPAWGAQLAQILKWVVLAVFAVLLLFLLLRALLSFLANFTGWARRLLDSLRAFWQALWGRRRGEGTGFEDESEERELTRSLPFSAFPDPFLSGRAGRMTITALVRYSFDALQAWARERHLPRREGETPLEFAERLAQEVPALEEDARRLARYYTGLAYARRAVLTEDCRQPLRQFWQLLTDLAERPLSAGAG